MGARAARNVFRHATILVTLVTIGCASGVTAPSSRTAEPAATHSGQLRIDQAQQKFAALASANGDASPSEVESVLTTSGAALALLYGDPGSERDAAVVVTVAHGHFTGSAAKIPAGGAVPTGTVLTQVLRADSGEQSDWGISDKFPDLSSLGAIVRG